MHYFNPKSHTSRIQKTAINHCAGHIPRVSSEYLSIDAAASLLKSFQETASKEVFAISTLAEDIFTHKTDTTKYITSQKSTQTNKQLQLYCAHEALCLQQHSHPFSYSNTHPFSNIYFSMNSQAEFVRKAVFRKQKKSRWLKKESSRNVTKLGARGILYS